MQILVKGINNPDKPGQVPELFVYCRMAAALSKQDVGQWAAKEDLVVKK